MCGCISRRAISPLYGVSYNPTSDIGSAESAGGKMVDRCSTVGTVYVRRGKRHGEVRQLEKAACGTRDDVTATSVSRIQSFREVYIESTTIFLCIHTTP